MNTQKTTTNEPRVTGAHAAVDGPRGTYELTRTQTVDRPRDEVFAFFSEARNLGLITPPWLSFQIVEAPAAMGPDVLISYKLRLRGIPVRWTSQIRDWSPPESFTDVQRRGPYALWEHTHMFTDLDDATEVCDRVVYRPPGGPLAPLVRDLLVRGQLEEIFDYRAARIEEIFSAG